MEIKEEKLLFLRVSLIVFLFFLANAGMYGYKSGSFSKGITGFSINSNFVEIYAQMSSNSRIFLLIQWALLALILLYVAIKDFRIKGERKNVVNLNIKANSRKGKTDIDILYDILKKKKQLKTSTIARAFKVKKVVAMEWCKILESANLAFIDYPGFGEPLIKIKEDEKELIKKDSKDTKHKVKNQEESRMKNKIENKKSKIIFKNTKQEQKNKKKQKKINDFNKRKELKEKQKLEKQKLKQEKKKKRSFFLFRIFKRKKTKKEKTKKIKR